MNINLSDTFKAMVAVQSIHAQLMKVANAVSGCFAWTIGYKASDHTLWLYLGANMVVWVDHVAERYTVGRYGVSGDFEVIASQMPFAQLVAFLPYSIDAKGIMCDVTVFSRFDLTNPEVRLFLEYLLENEQ